MKVLKQGICNHMKKNNEFYKYHDYEYEFLKLEKLANVLS